MSYLIHWKSKSVCRTACCVQPWHQVVRVSPHWETNSPQFQIFVSEALDMFLFTVFDHIWDIALRDMLQFATLTWKRTCEGSCTHTAAVYIWDATCQSGTEAELTVWRKCLKLTVFVLLGGWEEDSWFEGLVRAGIHLDTLLYTLLHACINELCSWPLIYREICIV